VPPGAALRSLAWRLRRAFFFTCDLRRFIFIELRRSCFPTARELALACRDPSSAGSHLAGQLLPLRWSGGSSEARVRTAAAGSSEASVQTET
jgi:hypothetical protein